jgi:hypothetical protein
MSDALRAKDVLNFRIIAAGGDLCQTGHETAVHGRQISDYARCNKQIGIQLSCIITTTTQPAVNTKLAEAYKLYTSRARVVVYFKFMEGY